MNDDGIYGRVSRECFPFTEEHIRKRLSFAEGYLNWKDEDWDRVIFSDETHCYLGHHGVHWVQRPIGAAYDKEYLTAHIPHEQRVSLWGCFCSAGIGEGEIFTDNLDGPLYKSILQNNLLQTSKYYFPSGHWWFQQDNDPKHKSHIASDWLFSHGVDCIDHPPHSPDLNPIEEVWEILKREVDKKHASNVEELKLAIEDCWNDLDPAYLKTLVFSMHSRCEAVIANNGYKIGY